MDEQALARYLVHALRLAPGGDDGGGEPSVRIEGLGRILGGASRHTWSFDASWRDGTGAERRRALILRIDPPGASLLDSDRGLEFAVYRGLAGSDIPVPEALWLEHDPQWLGAPFFVMQRIDGCETAPTAMFREPYVQHLERIGRRLFEIGGRIAAFDWQAAGLATLDGGPPAPGDCWRRELERWAGVIEAHRLDAQPVVRAAIDRLRRTPPPPAQRISLVHGDYRNGNVLYDAEGRIQGVLDWEMAHLGDPLEDLAWTCMPDWRWGRPEHLAGLLPEPEAFATWEAASGLRVDPEGYRWWALFSQVKAQGIWLTGDRVYLDGRSDEIRLPMIGVLFRSREDQVIAELAGFAQAARVAGHRAGSSDEGSLDGAR